MLFLAVLFLVLVSRRPCKYPETCNDRIANGGQDQGKTWAGAGTGQCAGQQREDRPVADRNIDDIARGDRSQGPPCPDRRAQSQTAYLTARHRLLL